MLGTTRSMHTGLLAALDAWTGLHMYAGNILCITAQQGPATARLHVGPYRNCASACVSMA